jgi:hypothetical protein
LIEGQKDDQPGRVVDEPPEAADPAPFAPPPSSLPPSASLAAPHQVIFYADAADRADLLNIGEAIEPLAELCLVDEAQTPFLAGIVGPTGSGKSFALHRLLETIENLAAAAGKARETPYSSRVVVIPIDAAGVAGDPAVAIASAAFAALERDRNGFSYAALADEAAHAGADPQRAAAAAAERHDEISKRLDAERTARDEVEARRARLADSLLYKTPGSPVAVFIRANRASIETRLRRFDLAVGDPADNYRDLVRDLDSAGAVARGGVVLRSIWAYRSQARWLATGLAAFVLAFAVEHLRGAATADWLRSLGAALAPTADWLKGHDDLLVTARQVLTVVGVLALAFIVWRAFAFAALLFRGVRLLDQDVRERQRELDASAARLNQRVASLTAEAEAAAKHAQATARRAGGAKPFARAPGPAFARGAEAPAKAARSFFVELGRLMSGTAPTAIPAPQRLIFAFDNLDALAPADALRLIEAANTMLGPGCLGLIACDPAILASADGADAARRRSEKLFQLVVNAETLGLGDAGRFAARLIGSNAVVSPVSRVDAEKSPLLEPLSQAEAALLTAVAPLAGGGPRGVKRFLNAYRIARLAKAPRPAIALMLAVRLGGDRAAVSAMEAALASAAADLPDPSAPPALAEAAKAARAANERPLSLLDARAAWDVARRYAIPD